MRRIILLVAVAMLMTLFAGVAQAQPADEAPVGGPGAHPHHVHTGNGGCVDINSVLFEPDDRGLHRASNETGPTQGPFHGTCAQPHPHRAPGH